MKISIEINCDNAAFEGDLLAMEIASICAQAARKAVVLGRPPGSQSRREPLRDSNGNACGYVLVNRPEVERCDECAGTRWPMESHEEYCSLYEE